MLMITYIGASEWRIKWIGQAWEDISANKDMVIRGFKKCGISVAIHGSDDNEINIKGLEDYQVESDDDDPFATSDDSNSSSDSKSLGSSDKRFMLKGIVVIITVQVLVMKRTMLKRIIVMCYLQCHLT